MCIYKVLLATLIMVVMSWTVFRPTLIWS